MAKTVLYNGESANAAQLILFNKNGLVSINALGILNTIGRKTESSRCDIKIDSPIVSRIHGEIALASGRYFYRDLNSTNGTYVNNALLKSTAENKNLALPLKDGDILCFDIKENGESHSACVYGLFAVCEKNTEWSIFQLKNSIAEICIGRSEKATLQLTNQTISERHASFFHTSNGWAIIDHKSTNGVYLNGKRITSPRYLKNFDVIGIAQTHFVFTDSYILFSGAALSLLSAQAELQEKPEALNLQTPLKAENQLIIDITERSVMQRFKKLMLLQNINITVSGGEMVLILGGSGAGKTTFINAVMGYEKADGKITYNDTDIYEEYEQMKYEIGFVPQQDLLRGSDTVYDTLSNAAEMKLPKSINCDARSKRIDSVLNELGLSREKATLVSKLSGGQRKRLSIAVELISNPSLFFLDEPDSGVDDIMGRGLMENLKAIANKGKIVMVITHSPERAADLFNKVLVLAKSTRDNCGHLAFFGSVKEAFDFFNVSSFREIVKKINRPDENGEGLSDYFIEKYINYTGGETNG